MQGCIFCAIVAGEAPAHRIAEDERTLAFLDVNPAVDGHTLVVPKAHAVNLFDVSPEDAAAVMTAAARVARTMQERLGCDGVNLVHASGAAAWQTVFHLHVHVLPRYHADGFPIWSAMIGRRGDRGALEAVAARLRRE